MMAKDHASIYLEVSLGLTCIDRYDYHVEYCLIIRIQYELLACVLSSSVSTPRVANSHPFITFSFYPFYIIITGCIEDQECVDGNCLCPTITNKCMYFTPEVIGAYRV